MFFATSIMIVGCKKESEEPKPSKIFGFINGAFSVSETKQVYFASGNLQYNQSSFDWRFAEHQYDICGEKNNHCGDFSHDGYIDLFGWSTASTFFGIDTAIDVNSYRGNFVDWGHNVGNDWYTLSGDEWWYLILGRSNCEHLKAVGCVNNQNGLILLPDNWQLPENIRFTPGVANGNGAEYYSQVNTFSKEQWEIMESAGAVFLPVSGSRTGSQYENSQNQCQYWSSYRFEPNPTCAEILFLTSINVTRTNTYVFYGIPVRLVKDVQ